MGWVSALFAIAAAVLAAGGVLKVRDPGPTRQLIIDLGLPVPGVLARLAGPVEAGLGAGALVVGGRWFAGAVAGAFGIFAVAVAVLLRRGVTAASCGCFGRLSAPPAPVHLAVDAGLALAAAAAAVTGAGGAVPLVRSAPGAAEAIVLGALLVLAVALTLAVSTVLPATLDAARPLPRAETRRAGGMSIEPGATR